MKINKHSKISDIINCNAEAIHAIARVNQNFRKLKNPILRRLLARHITIEDAAKIGNTNANTLLQTLEQIGFDVEYEQNNTEIDLNEKNIKMNNKTVIEFDARPMLAGGTDPFNAIAEKTKVLKPEEALLVINTFEPIPLINKYEANGWKTKVERPEDGSIRTYFWKDDDNAENIPEKKTASGTTELTFEQAEAAFLGKLHEIDVRDLEMPMPMVTILEELEKLDGTTALYVHHKRLPQYLLPELESRGYIYAKKEIDENNVKFIIYK